MVKLPSIKFVHSIAILSTVLIAGILIEFLLYFNTLQKQWSDSKVSVDSFLIVDKLGKVAHEHAVERGLTAGFMGSKGERFGSELSAQRDKADQAVADLLAIKSDQLLFLTENDVKTITQNLQGLMSSKTTIRRAVDNLEPNNGAFDYYSSVNQEALDSIISTSLHIKDNALKVELDGLLSILWIKETAGQIRGKVNGLFASGKITPANYYQVNGYINREKQRIEEFKRYASEDSFKHFNSFASQTHWQQVDDVENLFTSGSDNSIEDPTNGEWFSIATKRIGDINSIATELTSQLITRANITSKETFNTIVFKLSAIGLVILLIILINYFIISSLKKRVAMVDSVLKNITENSDLSLRMDDGRNDEFGQIGRAIDSHLKEVSQVFNEFSSASQHAMDMIGSIKERVDSANTNASDQNQRSEQISGSMNNILESASDVSSNMDSAKESMQSATVSAEKSREESEKMRSIFSDLTSDFSVNLTTIEELANHSQEISSILDTISGIAEQTNLLALNAAIEAARAGEQGRGFAVVADEVRSLAQKTQESTTNIRDMIERLNSSSQSALNSMQESQLRVQETESRVETSVEAVDAVNAEINNVKQIIQKVATVANTQVDMINTIETNVSQMKELSHDTLEKTRSVNTDTQDLSGQMEQLDTKIRSFKI